MFALYPRHVVVDRRGIVVEVRNRVGSTADGEFAFGHLQSVGDGLIDINAQCVGVDVVRRVAAIVYPAQDRDVSRVHEFGAECVRVAECECLDPFNIAGLVVIRILFLSKYAGN